MDDLSSLLNCCNTGCMSRDTIGGSRGGPGGHVPPLEHLKLKKNLMNIFVGVRVLPNWLIDS